MPKISVISTTGRTEGVFTSVAGLKLAPEAAARLETLLKTALRAKPEDRFPSFAAFKKSIDAVL